MYDKSGNNVPNSMRVIVRKSSLSFQTEGPGKPDNPPSRLMPEGPFPCS